MENILNFTREQLVSWFENQGIRSFRAGQIFKWVYLSQADSFEQMTNLSKDLRVTLARHFVIPRLILEKKEQSSDLTEKFLFKLEDGNYIESVLLLEKDHYTLCVSSQVGCKHGCKFCLTAKGKFIRNLNVAEIVSQIRDAKLYVELKNENARPLSNIVFMGMGEPLANYQNLIQALNIICDSDYGLKLSSRRVTVSTAGLVPQIIQLGKDTSVNLAVSLNAVDDQTRSRLMPVNNKYPIKELINACRKFEMKPRNKITFEYILIKGINDSKEDAVKLVDLLASIKAKVNLIVFNEHQESEFKKPGPEQVNQFLQILLDRNLTAMVRKSKGEDISAACGQLRAKLSI